MELGGWHAALAEFLAKGGPAIWAIAALSVVTLGLILWKGWRLALMGAWAGARAERAVALWLGGDADAARASLAGRVGLRAALVRAAMDALAAGLPETAAREETTRVARGLLDEARRGLRALELIASIAPLLGLFGTVLGMIEAFQTLEQSGARADPAALAGGIWEALLTTAAGMAVAIPAALAEGWFASVAARAQHDMEDLATRLFVARAGQGGG
ncbi:MotA/TolQ/ExbB proton channel family protein [Rhodovulum sp. YNF3179]|uniref:MotA/TolQ/ExbB proton channel family protein n=1 Tax=Rhodovulum sp. YNF3179 TaxID=3425127 RepID=UPI003D328BD4